MHAVTGGRTWLLGLLIVPAALGFLLVGAQLGIALGCATAALLIVVAARARPDEPIEVAEPAKDVPGGLFVLAVDPIEDPHTAGVIAAMADPSRPEASERGPLVVAPARTRTLDRWADDIERGRFEGQRSLAVSLASLATAGVQAEGRLGDGDPLRAAEDALRSYAASEVIVVAGEGREERRLRELEQRLEIPLRRVLPAYTPAGGVPSGQSRTVKLRRKR